MESQYQYYFQLLWAVTSKILHLPLQSLYNIRAVNICLPSIDPQTDTLFWIRQDIADVFLFRTRCCFIRSVYGWYGTRYVPGTNNFLSIPNQISRPRYPLGKIGAHITNFGNQTLLEAKAWRSGFLKQTIFLSQVQDLQAAVPTHRHQNMPTSYPYIQ